MFVARWNLLKNQQVVVNTGYQHGWCELLMALQWRHNERGGVSNHQPHYCLLNPLFRRRSKKTSKLRFIGLCAWNSPVTQKMFPFDDVIMESGLTYSCMSARSGAVKPHDGIEALICLPVEMVLQLYLLASINCSNKGLPPVRCQAIWRATMSFC